MQTVLTQNALTSVVHTFEEALQKEERSSATVEKYLRTVRDFIAFVGEQALDKSLVLAYKEALIKRYAVVSVNTALSALNGFFSFLGRHELRVKPCKIQRKIYVPAERELSRAEYFRLVHTAQNVGNTRLALLIETVCGTGIRVSELPFITAEAAESGEATVSCKGKTRTVFLVPALRKKLLRYARTRKIVSGPIFVTRSGRPIDRSDLWREMKAVSRAAGVPPGKVFPHNLRHLFARTFYGMDKDIAKLADILGHSSINTTRIYIITTGAEHRRRMEQMHLIS